MNVSVTLLICSFFLNLKSVYLGKGGMELILIKEHIVVMNKKRSNLSFVITLIGRSLFSVKMDHQPNHTMYSNNLHVTRFRKP